MHFSFVSVAAILLSLPPTGVATVNHSEGRDATQRKPSHSRIPVYNDRDSRAINPHRKTSRARSVSYSHGHKKRGHEIVHTVAKSAAKRGRQPKYEASKRIDSQVKNAADRHPYPEKAKAQCDDGSYSQSGSCAGHGGIFWLISRK